MIVHQDDVDPGLLQAVHPLEDHVVKQGWVSIAHGAIGAHLPDHELGMHSNRIRIKSGKFLRCILAPDSPIDDSKMRVGKSLVQSILEQRRVAVRAVGRHGAFGRGRTKGDNQPLVTVGDGGAKMGQVH